MKSFVILLLFVVYKDINAKDGCGQGANKVTVNGDFGQIRQKAINCSFLLGNTNKYSLATITFTNIILDDNDYFLAKDIDDNIITGPHYGICEPFSIVTNKQVSVYLVTDPNLLFNRREFRGYIKTHNHVVEPSVVPIPNEELEYCFRNSDVTSKRSRRSPTPAPKKCRNIVIKDIIEWNSKNQLVQMCQEWKIIPKENEIDCGRDLCEGKLEIGRDLNSIDGYRWRCAASFTDAHRRTTRKRTFFEKSKLKIWQIVVFVNLWIRKVPLWVIEEQALMSHPTAVDWSSFCREVAYEAIVRLGEKLGGPGKIVEIDEWKFGKRKYHKGHYVEGAWVFGGIERGSGKLFMEVVPDRSANTLLQLIDKWVEKGTTIHSDQWSSYRTLNLRGYIHRTVNHHENFKDPQTGVHTNSIEAVWGHAKAGVPQRGRKAEFLGGYLARYMVARRAVEINKDPMVLFFDYARRLYDPANPVDIEIGEPDETEGAVGGSGTF